MAGNKDHITYHDFLRQLKKGDTPLISLFQGPETFLIEECLEQVKQTLIQPETTAFNYHKFSANDAEIGEVIDQAQTMPFLSKWRLIIITETEEFSARAQEKFLPYLSNPNPATCIIMTASKLDNRTKFAQAIKKSGEIVQFWKLYDNELPGWICGRAKGYGYSLSPQTAAYFIEFVGNDLRQLDNELRKVIAYTTTKEITSAVIQQVVGDIRERDIFELVDAVSGGNAIEALRILNQLLIEGEEPLKILAMVIRQFRLLWKTKAHLAEQRSLPANQLAGKIGVPPRTAESLYKQVPRFSQKQLKEGMKRLYDVDRGLKSSATSPKILLEDVLFDLCMASEIKA